MFQQVIDPLHNVFLTWLVALVPVALLLVLLAVFRWSAWTSTLVGSLATLLLGWAVWQMPLGSGVRAYLHGSTTGVWNVDWITFWGVILFNTLVVSGAFERFQRWISLHGARDVRVQAILFAWAFGALLEGLVGFGYPWAVVAPILIALGIPDLDAIRVAAIANNAPVSYGALGAPIIALAAVTGLPLLALSGSIGHIVAILALLPPWVLIYLVSGNRGFREGWPLAVVGSLGYVAGQFPVAVYLGPYLPDIAGAIVCIGALLLLLKFWKPKEVLGYGGVPYSATIDGARGASSGEIGHPLTAAEVWWAWMPFAVLVAVVVLWTGPWSPLPKIAVFTRSVTALPSLAGMKPVAATFTFTPFVGGSAILASWIAIALLLRITFSQLGEIFRRTWGQMWGRSSSACLSSGSPTCITIRESRRPSRSRSRRSAGHSSSSRRSWAGSEWPCREATPRPTRCSARFRTSSGGFWDFRRCCCRHSTP